MRTAIHSYEGVRIAMVSPLFPQVGGVATQARLLTDCLQNEGIEVFLLPDREIVSWMDKTPFIRTIHQYRQRIKRLEQVAHKIDGVVVLSCSDLHIHLVAMPIVEWSVARGIPVVLSHRGANTETQLSQNTCDRRAFQKFSHLCAAIHVSSPYLKRVLAKHGIESMSVPIIIDAPSLHYRPRTVDLSLIVNTRSMGTFHGGPLLIRSFTQILRDYPSALLTIAGRGSDFQPCLELTRSLHLEDFVHFPGAMSAVEIADLLDNAGLLLNTSTADNIPNAILEAFAAGVPVVSSAVGGIPDLIGDDERGFLAHGMEPSDFVDALKRAMADSDLTLSKVVAAREWVESLTWQALRQSYLKTLIDPLLTNVRRKPSW